METAIVIDGEFLTAAGARGRFWCGLEDPDPIICQIGAVKLGLDDGDILDTARMYIRPIDRYGRELQLDPFLTDLTGICQSTMDWEGISLREGLAKLDRFSNGSDFWSWGKDELNLAISCYIAGLGHILPATRFDNARKLLLKAGMPLEDIQVVESGGLATYFGLSAASRRTHDALDDALSVASVLRHLLVEGSLSKEDFRRLDVGRRPDHSHATCDY